MSNGVPTFVCTFLAHVDHGKTTLCDLLLSQYHSTLSSSQVGEARLLDSSDEEVRRGITIKQGYMVIEANVPKEGGGEERVVMGGENVGEAAEGVVLGGGVPGTWWRSTLLEE